MTLCVVFERNWQQENIEKIHDVQQTKEMIPLISREITFGQHVRKLFLFINKFDLDFRVQICRMTNQKQICEFLTRVSS